jgi:Ca2+-binding EF-hand superfamily protein
MAHTPPTPAQFTADVFHFLDTNGDHKITLGEIEGVITAHDHGHTPNFAPLEKLFDHLDTDGNGALSVGEVTTAVTHVLTLTHDHAPLPHNVHDLLALLGHAAHHDILG